MGGTRRTVGPSFEEGKWSGWRDSNSKDTEPEAVEGKDVAKPAQDRVLEGGTDTPVTSCPALARVVTAWGKLPPALRAAILAIVDSTKGGQP